MADVRELNLAGIELENGSSIVFLADFQMIKTLFLGWKDDVDRLMHATKTRKCSNVLKISRQGQLRASYKT